MLLPVIFGNWTALAVTFYFFRRLLRSTSKLLQTAKLCTGGFIPQLLCSQFKHRTLQAESKADLLKHLLSEGQNTLGTPWSLSELDKLCFFLHWDPDLGGYWKSLTEVKRSCCSFHNFFFSLLSPWFKPKILFVSSHFNFCYPSSIYALSNITNTDVLRVSLISQKIKSWVFFFLLSSHQLKAKQNCIAALKTFILLPTIFLLLWENKKIPELSFLVDFPMILWW